MVAVKEWLKDLRREKGLSQEETAKCLGVSQQYLSLIEQGKRQRKISLDLALKIAKLFDVSVDFVLKHEQEDERKDEEGNQG